MDELDGDRAGQPDVGRSPGGLRGQQRERRANGLATVSLGRPAVLVLEPEVIRDDPPEICVARVARLVSVLVAAEIRLTLILGFCFSNAWIRTWRTSVPLVVIGLADHEIVPVAAPVADAVAPPPLLDEVLPPLLQPARASAPVTPTAAVSCQALRGRLPGFLRDPMCPPLYVVTS